MEATCEKEVALRQALNTAATETSEADFYVNMYSDHAVDIFTAAKAGASPARKKTLILLSNFCENIRTEVTIRSSQSRNEIYIEYAVTPEPYYDYEDGCYLIPDSTILSPFVARLSVPLDPTLGKPYRRPPTARKRKSSDRNYNIELRALDSPDSQTIKEFKTVLISAKNMGALGHILRPFGANGPLATLAPAAFSVLRKYMTILSKHPFHICLQKTKDELILRTQKPNGLVDALALQVYWTEPS